MKSEHNFLSSIIISGIIFICLCFICTGLAIAQGVMQYFPYLNAGSNPYLDYFNTQGIGSGAGSLYPFNFQPPDSWGEMYPNPDFGILSVGYFSRNSQQQMLFGNEGDQVVRKAHTTFPSSYMHEQNQLSYNVPSSYNITDFNGYAIQSGEFLWNEWPSSLSILMSSPMSFNQGPLFNMYQWQNQMPSNTQTSFTTWGQPFQSIPMTFPGFQSNTPWSSWLYR